MAGQTIFGVNDSVYREYPALNNSLLTSLSQGLPYFRKARGIDATEEEQERERNKAAFRKGSALDCLLTMPARFEEFFTILPKFNPSNQEAILIREWVRRGNVDFDPAELLELSNEMGLWKNIKNRDTRLKKFTNDHCVNELLPYFSARGEKTVLTEAEFELVKEAVNEIRKDEYVSKLLNPIDNHTLYTQLMVTGNVDIDGDDVELKGLLDFTTVNHVDKVITPVDLKTTGKSAVTDFRRSFLDFGYITQSSMYSYLLERWRDDNHPGYTINNFLFVVKSLTYMTEPVVKYQVPDEVLEIGRYGGKIYGKRVYGWEELVRMYLEQEATGQYYFTPKMLSQMEEIGAIPIDFGDVEINESGVSPVFVENTHKDDTIIYTTGVDMFSINSII